MKKIEYKPTGVCCKLMEVETDNGIVTSVKFHGGCDGNLQGIAKLVAGRDVNSVICALKGIDCRGRGTSCPDQLAKALESYD